MNISFASLCAVLTLCLTSSILEAGSSLVYYDENEELQYGSYANRGQIDPLNILPDFSYCGYKGGGIAIEEVPVMVALEPIDGDDWSQIQSAINQVSNRTPDEDGFRGVVLLKAGLYDLSQSLVISKSGVVLRGEGQIRAAEGGTELYATGHYQYDLIKIKGSSSGTTGSSIAITSDYVGSGSREFMVSDASSLNVGDRIKVVMTPNQAWIDALGMGDYGWTASDYEIAYERRIMAIDGNRIQIDIPLVQSINSVYGGGYVSQYTPSGRITQCGVEDMWLRSEYASDEDESHAWSAVVLNYTENCWVKGVTAEFFGYSCVLLDWAYFTTVQDCAMLDPKSITTGGRKYSFNINNGSCNLFQRCYARGGRHDAVTGSRVAGPNAFVDFYCEGNLSNSGPHHRYATGTLFDRIHLTGVGSDSVGLDVENRQDSGSGHGWSGAQTVFWNCTANSSVCDAPYGAMNFNIGFTGRKSEGNWAPEEPEGYWDSFGAPVSSPASLYRAQLKERLGVDAIASIFTVPQENGEIDYILKKWAGVGALPESLEEICDQGTSYLGGCREADKDSFMGRVSDYYFLGEDFGYLYHYGSQSWFWAYAGASVYSTYLWSWDRSSYLWTNRFFYPYYWDFSLAKWLSFEEESVINLLVNGDFSEGLDPWTLYVNSAATANASVASGEVGVVITSPGTADYHIQFRQSGVLIEEGKSYEFRFKAKAGASRTIKVSLMMDSSPYTIYASKTFNITAVMEAYAFEFTMSYPTDDNTRVRFALGLDTAKVNLDDVVLEEK